MKMTKLASLVALFALAGCQSNSGSQTFAAESTNGNSSLIIAKSANDFSDADIEVPAYFNTQGLQFCEYTQNESDARCPLTKKTIRMYFGDVKSKIENNAGVDTVFNQINNSVNSYDVKALENTLENQFAGVNRFRILTRDNKIINSGLEEILQEEGAGTVAKKMSSSHKLETDYLFKVDVLKTADMIYGAKQSLFQSAVEISTGVIDPYTREKLSYPNVGKIRVSNFDVRNKDEYTSVIVNGDYYRGFNYASNTDVSAVLNEMASRSFDIMLTRLLKEMPATAQVLGIKGDRISLDRGQNAGVLPNETMVVFEYSAGFVEPIGVATVNPSAQSAQGKMVRWKKSRVADEIQNHAEEGIYKPTRDRKVFAVSVGVPADFLKERSTWTGES